MPRLRTGGKSLHFLSDALDANMSEENVLVSDLKEVTLSSVKELITIIFSLWALYDLNQMRDLDYHNAYAQKGLDNC